MTFSIKTLVIAFLNWLGGLQGPEPRFDPADDFGLFARYSITAYCPSLYNGFGASAVCPNAREPGCRDLANVRTTVEFTNTRLYGVGGYVAVDAARRHIVLVFKGTDSLIDVITDVSKIQMDTPDLCPGCRVHWGFGMAFQAVRDKAEAAIFQAMDSLPAQPPPRVVATGHSLGAAVATVAAAYLRQRGIIVDLYAYGSPRVGNAAFAGLFADGGRGFTARITNARDIVTMMPTHGPLLLRPYTHIAPEYWYKGGLDGSAAQYAPDRRVVCRSEDECGSAHCFGWTSWCSIPDHQAYGGIFKPCGLGGRLGKSLGATEPVLPDTRELMSKFLRGSNETLGGEPDHARPVTAG